MGREIRRVLKNWEHPRYEEGQWKGQYRPCYDKDFETAAALWKAAFRAWEDGTHEDLQKYPDWRREMEFWE